MIKETLEALYEIDFTITVDTIEHTRVGDKECVIVKFKKAEPEIHYKIDSDNHIATLNHLIKNKGTETSRFNCKEPNESNGPKANQDKCFIRPCEYEPFKGPHCAFHGDYNDPEVIAELEKNGIDYKKEEINKTLETKPLTDTEDDKQYDCALERCDNLITEEQRKDSNYCSESCWQFGTTNKDTCICPYVYKKRGTSYRMAHCQWSGHFEKEEIKETFPTNPLTKEQEKILLCNKSICQQRQAIGSDYCEEHRMNKKKKVSKHRYECGECGGRYTKTLRIGYCSNICWNASIDGLA